MNIFVISWQGAQDEFLNLRMSLTASVDGKGQKSLSAAAEVDISDMNNDDQDAEIAVGLDDVERLVAKGLLRNFQEFFCGKKCRVPYTVPKAFQLAIDLINEDGSADAGASTDPTSMKYALTTLRSEAKRLQVSWPCYSGSKKIQGGILETIGRYFDQEGNEFRCLKLPGEDG